MKKRFILIFLACQFAITEIRAQVNIHLYYNDEWELTSKESATYIREAEINLDRLHFHGKLKDYMNDVLVMEGTYLNNKRDGLFKTYYDDGTQMSIGNYKNDKRDSIWSYFYPNGNLKQIVNFTERDFSVSEFYNQKGKQLIENGSGKWEHIYSRQYSYSFLGNQSIKKEQVKVSGKFKDHKRNGTWQLLALEDQRIIQSLIYNNGVLKEEPPVVIQQFPDMKNDKHEVTSAFQIDTLVFKDDIYGYDTDRMLSILTGKEIKIQHREAGYPQGDLELYSFIGKNIRYPKQSFNDGIEGKVFVKVTIGEDGLAKRITIFKGLHEELNKEAIRVIQLIPEWLSALREGGPIESSIVIPITFKVE